MLGKIYSLLYNRRQALVLHIMCHKPAGKVPSTTTRPKQTGSAQQLRSWGRLSAGGRTHKQPCSSLGLQGSHEDALIEHSRQLRVGQGQGPQAQVAGCVADGPQHELDGVDHLQTAACQAERCMQRAGTDTIRRATSERVAGDIPMSALLS